MQIDTSVHEELVINLQMLFQQYCQVQDMRPSARRDSHLERINSWMCIIQSSLAELEAISA